MSMKIKLVDRLLLATFLLAVVCLSSALAEDGLPKSGCPDNVEQVISGWYAPDTVIPSILKNWYAIPVFETEASGDKCKRLGWPDEWSCCKGDDCSTLRGNHRLKVRFYHKLSDLNSKHWIIFFDPPIKISDISWTSMSSCYLIPNCKTDTGAACTPGKLDWTNPDFDTIPPGDEQVVFLLFEMPPKRDLGTYCMWEIKWGNNFYHEHFATNDDCYGWVEVESIPRVVHSVERQRRGKIIPPPKPVVIPQPGLNPGSK